MELLGSPFGAWNKNLTSSVVNASLLFLKTTKTLKTLTFFCLETEGLSSRKTLRKPKEILEHQLVGFLENV